MKFYLVKEAEAQCNPNPCLNRGVCSAFGPQIFFCNCPSNFAGSRCEFNIISSPLLDECFSDTCLNGGVCQRTGILPEQFVCICPPRFTGFICETPVADLLKGCEIFPCKNGGFCQRQDEKNVCICPTNFTGKTCESAVKLSG